MLLKIERSRCVNNLPYCIAMSLNRLPSILHDKQTQQIIQDRIFNEKNCSPPFLYLAAPVGPEVCLISGDYCILFRIYKRLVCIGVKQIEYIISEPIIFEAFDYFRDFSIYT